MFISILWGSLFSLPFPACRALPDGTVPPPPSGPPPPNASRPLSTSTSSSSSATTSSVSTLAAPVPVRPLAVDVSHPVAASVVPTVLPPTLPPVAPSPRATSLATTASTAKSQRALLNLRSMEGGVGGSLAASIPLDRRESFRALNGLGHLGGPATPRGSADPPSLLGSVLGGEDGEGGRVSPRSPPPAPPRAPVRSQAGGGTLWRKGSESASDA